MTVVLHVPLPPSPNRRPLDPMAIYRWRRKTKRDTWFAAIAHPHPTPVSRPPEKVCIRAHFRLRNLRDEDNLVGSMKYAIDSLRTPRKDEKVDWRDGLCERKGYFVDDDPAHCTLAKPTQEIDRKNPGLTLTIEPVED